MKIKPNHILIFCFLLFCLIQVPLDTYITYKNKRELLELEKEKLRLEIELIKLKNIPAAL